MHKGTKRFNTLDSHYRFDTKTYVDTQMSYYDFCNTPHYLEFSQTFYGSTFSGYLLKLLPTKNKQIKTMIEYLINTLPDNKCTLCNTFSERGNFTVSGSLTINSAITTINSNTTATIKNVEIIYPKKYPEDILPNTQHKILHDLNILLLYFIRTEDIALHRLNFLLQKFNPINYLNSEILSIYENHVDINIKFKDISTFKLHDDDKASFIRKNNLWYRPSTDPETYHITTDHPNRTFYEILQKMEKTQPQNSKCHQTDTYYELYLMMQGIKRFCDDIKNFTEFCTKHDIKLSDKLDKFLESINNGKMDTNEEFIKTLKMVSNFNL